MGPDEHKKAVERFNEYVSSLNEQFSRWVAQQWVDKPTKFWCQGLTDYLRHAVIIKREHEEVLAELEKLADDLGDRRHEAQLTIMPLQHSKVIHFIRHGEAYHNIGRMNEDARLTERGWRQADALGAHLARVRPGLDIQVVVVSPMMRTLETAAAVFGAGPLSARAKARKLMAGQGAVLGERAQRASIAVREGLPIVAFEGCRERLGSAPCDRRGDVRVASCHFPGVDFSYIQAGPDEIYDRHRLETEHTVQERGAKFLQWLMLRPESRIAVVTHCGFLYLTLAAFGHDAAHTVQEDLHRAFQNCEMRSMVITDAAGGGKFNPTWWPGGEASLH